MPHPPPTPDLAVVILAFDEEIHLARCLEAIRPIARQVFVIDSGSTDRTVEIARRHDATVLVHPFTNQARQFNWALAHAPIACTWVMRLDADEVVEPDLAAEIAARLPGLPAGVAGINLNRKHIFLGRWIRHGGRYPLTLLRVWRHGQGRVEDRWMDEHVVVSGGETVLFEGGFADHNLRDITFFTAKHNLYATREAVDVLNRRMRLLPGQSRHEPMASRQAALKRLIKERLFNKLPFFVGPAAYFLYRFIVQRGFLDGREGLIYHVLQGFWYRFLVGAKIVELERSVGHLADRGDIQAELSRLTGLRLSEPVAASENARMAG